MSDLLSVTEESRMVPTGISDVGSSDSSQAACPALADPSHVLVSDEPTTGHPRVMECVDPSE